VQEDDTVPVGADLAVIGEGAAAGGSGEPGGGDEAQSGAAQGDAAEEDAAESQDASAPEPEQPEPEAPSTEQPVAEQTSEPEQSQAQGSGQQQSSGGADGSGGSGGASGGQTVTMPALGESVTEGTVTRWLKAEGDTVEVDEPLLEVSTDKVDTEIPSPAAGVLSKILVQEDEVVPVGGDLAVIGGESGGESGTASGDESSDESAEAADARPSAEQEAPEAPSTEAPSTEAPSAEAPAAEAPAQASGQQEAPAQEKADKATEQASQPAAHAAPTEAAPATATAPAASTSTTTSTTTSTSANKGASDDSSAYVTPLVRKLAAQHSVDLGALTGTGIGGRIRKQDVLDAAENARAAAAASAAPAQPAAAAPAPSVPAGGGAAAAPVSDKRGTREKMTRLRKVIATRMVESLRVSAQLTTVVEVDLTKVARLRARAKSEFERREGVKLSYLPFLALAAVEALKAHPNVNASVDGEEIVYHGQENLAIAVDTEKGLLVPVVKNAGDLNIAGLARAIADLADRTRNNKIAPDDLAGGTFTITNTGSRGALFDTPIINQPQVAILGTGALVKRPVVVADEDGGETIAVRSMMYLALSYDHRIVDGADAARFLGAMKTRLEEGRFEASLGL
jgi:2-oxoglutarate dehydrogenase E2 component (dihydrolipoamide succinyltransferase)